ncbi:D-alanyl-D-alanine carboxypeptidase [Methyloligella sp. 2.7D]|uniref:D-alanyl-D-alanine carboxypeptidase family protein n=1 Tax=unclassified Methyloligella TaxID=2625955 RepID=UPI00157BE8F8|nr:D-alanyl-D-alanine carboxypeptidase [Methyloligella sp. GL2]QKP76863.1 D-alanyl-D-alanine carboxypeptidase [Methyloligella sp. GL2]
MRPIAKAQSATAAAFSLLLALTLILGPATAKAQMAPPKITAQSAFVLNADTGQVLYSKNADKRFRSLSITKLITGYILVHTFGNRLDLETTITPNDLAHGSNAGLKVGDIWSLRDLLYAMLMVSGNDAATAIADYVGRALLAQEGRQGDGVQRFVEAMNGTAAAIGANQTNFADADGLSANNTSTAYDLALIGSVAFRDPRLLPFWSCSQHAIHIGGPNARTVTLHSKVEIIGEPGIVGAKTGSYFSKGLYHLIAGWRAPNGQTIVAVVLGSASHPARYNDVRAIINALPQDYPELNRAVASVSAAPPPFQTVCR